MPITTRLPMPMDAAYPGIRFEMSYDHAWTYASKMASDGNWISARGVSKAQAVERVNQAVDHYENEHQGDSSEFDL